MMMKELHSEGKTVEDIAHVFTSAPLDSHVISAIKTAHSLGCDLKIMSDANTFFIERILKDHGIYECFTEINTNPNFVNGAGKLRISPYHGFNSTSSHGFSLRPPNMCKEIDVSIRHNGGKGGRRLIGNTRAMTPNKNLVIHDQDAPEKEGWTTHTKQPAKKKK